MNGVSVSLPILQAGLIGEALESGPVGVLVADDDMRYLAVNRYACELLGYAREELLAMRIPDLYADDGTERELGDFVAQHSWQGEPRLRHKDGTEHRYRVLASETRIGALQFFVAVFWPAD
jgi:PAS domain S-box-containing protein